MPLEGVTPERRLRCSPMTPTCSCSEPVWMKIREQIERDLSQSDAWSWTLGPQSISSAGAGAWPAGDVVIRVVLRDRTLDVPHRLTTVLERRDAKWLIVQMHLSVASQAQAIGQSFPTNLEAVTEAVGRERVDLQGRVAPDGTVTLLFTDIEGSTPRYWQ